MDGHLICWDGDKGKHHYSQKTTKYDYILLSFIVSCMQHADRILISNWKGDSSNTYFDTADKVEDKIDVMQGANAELEP